MPEATPANTAQTLTPQQAAAEIVALINASPRSPWPDEIEAIVARVAGSAASHAHDEALAVDRATWRKLVIEAEATLHAKDLLVGEPRLPAAEAVSDAAFERLRAFEASIWERPARSLADLPFLADLLVYQLWPGYSMTEAFPGNDPLDLDALFEAGPYCQDDDGRTGVLLRAIRDLIGMPKPMDASDAALLDKVRAAIRREETEGRRYISGDDGDAQTAVCNSCWDDLHAIQKQIPFPPVTAAQMLMHAEIAYHGADKDHNDKLYLDRADCFEGPAARLIEACLSYFGGVRL